MDWGCFFTVCKEDILPVHPSIRPPDGRCSSLTFEWLPTLLCHIEGLLICLVTLEYDVACPQSIVDVFLCSSAAAGNGGNLDLSLRRISQPTFSVRSRMDEAVIYGLSRGKGRLQLWEPVTHAAWTSHCGSEKSGGGCGSQVSVGSDPSSVANKKKINTVCLSFPKL